MPSLFDPIFDTSHRHVRTRQPQKEQDDAIAICLHIHQPLVVGATRKGRFKPEIRPPFGQLTNALGQQSPGSQVLGLARDRRQPSSDQVRIQELLHFTKSGRNCEANVVFPDPWDRHDVDLDSLRRFLLNFAPASSFGLQVAFAASRSSGAELPT